MEKIETLHPDPSKQGVNISRAKYDLIRETILDLIRDRGEITFADLTTQCKEQLAGRFEGSIPWYVVTVKLDLEARGEIERIPNRRPQQLRLAN
jgi:hypothetical protein